MPTDIHRYRFPGHLSLDAINASLVLAAWGVESLHGEEVARRDAGYFLDPDRRQLVVDASLPAGLDFDRLFRGYVCRGLGESLEVERPSVSKHGEADRG